MCSKDFAEQHPEQVPEVALKEALTKAEAKSTTEVKDKTSEPAPTTSTLKQSWTSSLNFWSKPSQEVSVKPFEKGSDQSKGT